MPDEYISREAALKAANEWVSEACMAPVMWRSSRREVVKCKREEKKNGPAQT